MIICKMKDTKQHPIKKWEVTIIEFRDNGNTYFKVTRRIPELDVAETKLFNLKEEAKKQFEKWLV